MSLLAMTRTLPCPDWKQEVLTFTDVNLLNSINMAVIGDLPTHNPRINNPDYCAFLVLSGHGEYEDTKGCKVPLIPGSYVQHIPGLTHGIRREESSPWMEISFRLSPDMALFSRKNGFLGPDEPVRTVQSWQERAEDFLGIMEESRRRPDNFGKAYARILTWIDSTLPPGKGEDSRTLAEAVKNKLRSRLSTGVSERELLSSFSYSYDYLRHLFKEKTGMTPREYREKARMEEAADMMRANGLSVATAAEMYGYSDQFVFSRAFKRVMNRPPRDFRLPGQAPDPETGF